MQGKITRTDNGWAIRAKTEYEDECYYDNYPLFLSNKILDYLIEGQEVEFETTQIWTQAGLINQAKIKL